MSILQLKSCDNLADLFTNSLPFAIFDKCVKRPWYEETYRFARFRGRTPIRYPDKGITLYYFPL
jgi:hypothetical protein